MTDDPVQEDLSTTPASLSERCRRLGLPVWRLDDSGAFLSAPTGWGPSEPWILSRPLRDLIGEAARGWLDQDRPGPTTLFTGCWILPVGSAPHGPRTTIALALGPDALASVPFEEICRSAGLETEAMRNTLTPLARFDRANIDRLAAMLRWMHDDLRQAAEYEGAIRQFSKELAHAYELVSLLYRLGRSMNWLTRPEDFVRTACTSLLGLLDFEWIAFKHDTSQAARFAMPGPATGAGRLPCSLEAFDALAGDLLSRTESDHWTMLLECGDNELASLVGSQVIAVPVMSGDEVAGLFLAGNKSGTDPEVTSIETQLLDATADYLGAFLHNVAMYKEQHNLFMGTIRALTAAIDAKDRYTRGHSERVAMMGHRLAIAIGMSEEEAERVRIAGLVHDVGKIGVPEAVLQKPGRLTDEEFEQIKRHPVVGNDILKDIDQLEDVLPGVLYHHERWDGRGYPQGRSGEDIPLLGRLLAVADAFDAMSSNRSYRPAIPRDKVLREITECAGTQFDPELAAHFVTLDLAEYDAMALRHHAQEAEAA